MGSQGAHPACIFLAVTLLVTAAATVLLITAMFTNHWEEISFSKVDVEKFIARNNATHSLMWLYDKKVAKITLHNPYLYNQFSVDRSKRNTLTNPKQESQHRTQQRTLSLREGIERELRTLSNEKEVPNKNQVLFSQPDRTVLDNILRASQKSDKSIRFKRQTTEVVMFLVPMHGGIWTLCVDLTEAEQKELRSMGFGLSGCVNYLIPEDGENSVKKDWIQRMKNLSISCALVCCIILCACAIVGSFGIITRQISAVLVTGVMYILATIFALFCLSIMHFKKRTKKDCLVLDTQVTPELNDTRLYTSGWSLSLGWTGTVTCLGAALLWLLLAKIMRYNPISLS